MQRALRPGPTASSGGITVVHRSIATGHRGANAQPGGGNRMSGAAPGIEAISPAPVRNTDASNPRV